MKKINTYFKKTIPLISFAILSINTFAQKKIDLKFNVANGSKYAMETNSKSKISQMGMEIPMDMQMNMNTLVADKKPNKMLTFQFTKIGLEMNAMGKDISINSDSTDKNSETFKKLTTKSFGCEIDKNGKIIQVVGLDSFSTVFGNDNPASNYFNEDAIKSMIGQQYSFYPSHPVAVGESWTNVSELTNNVKMKANTTYTLDKVENDVAYIKVISTLATEGDQKIKANGMELNMNMSGKQNGEITVDTKTGMFISTHILQDLDGKVSVMGQEIPMKIKSDVSGTSKKL